MSDLKLDSLRIQNFRTFRDLTIDRLGRVNLIVGKNNVGKTALLEAVLLWMRRGRLGTIGELLEVRDELDSERREGDYRSKRRRFQERKITNSARNLLNRDADPSSFSVGPYDESRVLHFAVKKSNQEYLFELGEGEEDVDLIVRFGSLKEARFSSEGGRKVPRWQDRSSIKSSLLIRSDGLSDKQRSYMWDNIVGGGMEKEKKIYRFMDIVDDRIEDIRFVGSKSRIPLAGLKDGNERISIRSMGGGMMRVLDCSIAFVNVKEGILLVDEIENGLHYSIQPDLWRMIFETAQELDVQVFATTHSHDCVKAFQQVSEEHSEEGMLIQLRRKRSDSEDVVAVTVDEEELRDSLEFQVDPR